jgi:MFS family permease
LTKIQESKDPNKRRVDWLGFLSFSTALFVLILALIRGNDDGWTSPLILGLLLGAVALLTVFIVAEWRQTDPMLDLTLFKRPAMCGVSLVALTLSASIFALFLYLTLYIQDDLGFGPLAAGVRFLPLTVLAFIVAPISGKMTVRIKTRYLLGSGLLLVAIGCLAMATTHASSSWTVLLPGFIIGGIGIGTVNPVLASSAISVVPPERSGMASGTNSTFRQVGIATGIAGLGSIFQNQIQHKTMSALASTPSGQAVISHGGAALRAAILGGGVHQAAAALPSAAGRAALLHAYRVGFSSSLNSIMVIGAVISFVGSIGAFVLVRQRDFVPSYAPPAQSASPEAVPTVG